MAQAGLFLFAVVVSLAPEGGRALKASDPYAPGAAKAPMAAKQQSMAAPVGGSMLKRDMSIDQAKQMSPTELFKNFAGVAGDLMKEFGAQGGPTHAAPPASQAMHGTFAAPPAVPKPFAATPALPPVATTQQRQAVSKPPQAPVVAPQQSQAMHGTFAAPPAVPKPSAATPAAPVGGSMLKTRDMSVDQAKQMSPSELFKNFAGVAGDIMKEFGAQGAGPTHAAPPTSQAMNWPPAAPPAVPGPFAATPAVATQQQPQVIPKPPQAPVAARQQPQAVPQPLAATPAVPKPVAAQEQPQAVPKASQAPVAAKEQPQVATVGGSTFKVSEHPDCACIQWNHLYGMHNVKCGAGLELSSYNQSYTSVLFDMIPADVLSQMCSNFFEKLSLTACFSEKFDTPARQWCYVKSTCAAAVHEVSFIDEETGREDIKDVSVKYCDASAGDEMMSSKTAERISTMAHNQHVDADLLKRLAF